ncbi:hypothetical protein [Cellvibrio fontiphilus]|uniref:Uncharacterized protein n=1 Tax=Cellvibrio fontiphilus TaxID=1815559 RepID=A0ABV7FHB3_9GAMM
MSDSKIKSLLYLNLMPVLKIFHEAGFCVVVKIPPCIGDTK